MNKIEKLIQGLHDLLVNDNKINEVYDPKDKAISLEIPDLTNIDIEQLKTNFSGNISYLFNVYCADTNYPGGKTSDAIDLIYDINMALSDDFRLLDGVESLLLLKTYLLVLFFTVTIQKEGNISDLLEKDLKAKSPFNNKKIYFRGEDNFDYQLIPSFYRRNRNDFPNDITIIDDEFLKKTYKTNGMYGKYNKIFTSKYGYGFLAFMQHTYAFSPFLDFTSSNIVALSFATTNIGKGNDGAIYTFDTTNDVSAYRLKDKRHVVYSKRKLCLLDKIGEKYLFECIFKDFEPMVRLRKNQSNDRMKYQKGIFMDVYQGIIINGVLLIPVGSEKIKKYRINCKYSSFNKSNIVGKIRKKYPQYKYTNLMNPYNFFKL